MKKNDFQFHVILTGGTIDSHYDPTRDTAVPNDKSVIPSFTEGLKLYNKIKFTEICMKDSRDITLNDQKNILKILENSPCLKVLITHGTYTMPDTARYLEANLKRKDQTIILTGSMIPLQGFSPSDAPFNLGYSFAQLEYLKKGIYICMNGRTFSPNEVVKTIKEGRFSSIYNREKL